MNLSPLNRRRIDRFKKNRRAVISLVIFMFMLVMSFCAEFIANDKPLVMKYQGRLWFPVFKTYTEADFGGFFETEADYRDPYLLDMIKSGGWMIWPMVRYSYDTIKYDTETPPPAPPSAENPLGLDDQGRDVFARVLYGFRLSVLFGFMLTAVTSVIGICAGAAQGYYGGRIDLWGQRFMEVWSGIPMLYLLILAGSIIRPGFWMLLFMMVIFGWMGLVGVVRAEFLKGRELEYVQSARVLGVKDSTLMFRHILPNALVAAMTFLPFMLSGSIGVLTSLDFLGFGMPPGSPSIGELLAAGKSNLHAPWLGITAFVTVSLMLSLLVFIGEGVRDALDPRHTGGRR